MTAPNTVTLGEQAPTEMLPSPTRQEPQEDVAEEKKMEPIDSSPASPAAPSDGAQARNGVKEEQNEVEKDEFALDVIQLSKFPIVSLSHGLRRKATPLELQSWVALALTLDGRDKVTKVLQYTARLLAWWLAGSHQAERFQALKVSLTESRKAFRLGRSLIEYQRLRSMGLIEVLGWHLHRSLNEGEDNAEASRTNPKKLFRRVSSNIGWGPATFEEGSRRLQRQPSMLVRHLSSLASFMYRPTDDTKPVMETPTLTLVGSAIKLLGLAGFWTADNLSFLTSSGLFDNLNVDTKKRVEKRKELVTRATLFANRSYFIGALAGLVANLQSYLAFRRETQDELKQLLKEVEDEDDFEAIQRFKNKAQEKQFVLFTALLKSCCDVLVFSNNPGVDLWQKQTGRKMHEGVHCIAGLLSAFTVLYNNFPSACN